MLVQDLAAWAPLAALREAVAPGLGDQWADVPGFTLLFGAIFLAAIPFWYCLVGLEWKKATMLASCAMSSVHGLLSALGAYEQMLQWRTLEVDQPNTREQSLLNQFSLAYMAADFFFFLIPFTPSDMLFIVHHFISAFYLVGALHMGRGAISSCLMFFMGEVTSPILNAFTISRELRHRSKLAFRVFAVASPAFTVSYIFVRSILAPPLVGWFVYTLWFRTPGIPPLWRIPMGACVALGILASQAWTVKLIKGYLRQRQKRKTA